MERYQWTREQELALLEIMRGQGERTKWPLVFAKYLDHVHGGVCPANLAKETLIGKWNRIKRNNSVLRPPPSPALSAAAVSGSASAAEDKAQEQPRVPRTRIAPKGLQVPMLTAQMGEYEAQRIERMHANRALLLEMGILLEKPGPVQREPKPLTYIRPSRRSLRVRGLDPRPMKPVAVVKTPRGIQPKQKLKRPENLDELLVTKSLSISSIFLPLELEQFHVQWLHRQIWPKGKRTVVKGMCPDHYPQFTDTSGFVRWSNATALFVDMPKSPSELFDADELPGYYDNVFEQQTQGDRSVVFFRWFASSKMTVQSPTILRLLQAERGDPELRLTGSGEAQGQETVKIQVAISAVEMEGVEPSPQTPPLPVLLFIRHRKVRCHDLYTLPDATAG